MSSWAIPVSTDRARCGNKIATLARLTAAGLPTPGGFAISADAFAALVPVPALTDRIRATLGDRPYDLDRLRPAYAEARRVIRTLPWPPRFAADVRDRAAGLAGPGVPLAVRSSADWEDTADHSTAGQLSSVVGVAGEEGLRAAIADVWASAFSPAAVTHRLRTGRPHEPGPLAVGVQPLVHAELSGVAYSAHPVLGDRSILVIEAIRGLGGPLTDGRVVPAHVELDRTGRVLRRRDARQHVTASYDAAAGTVVERPTSGAVTLSDAHLDQIRHILLRAEAVLGCPVDAEWCWEPAAGLVLLQSRPIVAAG